MGIIGGGRVITSEHHNRGRGAVFPLEGQGGMCSFHFYLGQGQEISK